jgi:hypothetical protein
MALQPETQTTRFLRDSSGEMTNKWQNWLRLKVMSCSSVLFLITTVSHLATQHKIFYLIRCILWSDKGGRGNKRASAAEAVAMPVTASHCKWCSTARDAELTADCSAQALTLPLSSLGFYKMLASLHRTGRFEHFFPLKFHFL